MKLIAEVVMVKVALVLPFGIVYVDGTLAKPEGTLLLRLTSIPLSGAGAVSVIVPVTGEPLFTVVGLTVREEMNGSGGTSVRVVACEPPP
jgi:hypothetical protein